MYSQYTVHVKASLHLWYVVAPGVLIVSYYPPSAVISIPTLFCIHALMWRNKAYYYYANLLSNNEHHVTPTNIPLHIINL